MSVKTKEIRKGLWRASVRGVSGNGYSAYGETELQARNRLASFRDREIMKNLPRLGTSEPTPWRYARSEDHE